MTEFLIVGGAVFILLWFAEIFTDILRHKERMAEIESKKTK